ncbi:hypothetical protein H4I95_01226 [Botrytis cinerea]
MILILSSPSKAKANDELYPIYPAEKFPSDEYDSMIKSNLQFSISVPFSLIHHLPTFHHSSTEDSTFSFVFTISTFSIYYNSSSTHSHAVRKKTNTLERYTHPFQNYTSN